MPKDNYEIAETSWSSEEKTWWSKRSLLEKRLLLALGAIVVLAVGFMIYVAIKPKHNIEGCSSPGCLKAAAQVITHIDPEVDPCDDFFKFACGTYIEYTHGDIKAASVQRVENQVQRQFDEILREPISDDDHYVVQMNKKLFQACMNETAVEDESLKIFEEHLKELKGWPVVIGYKWKERFFDWKEMVAKLRIMGYPYRMMMDVRPMHDPSDSSQFIPYISEPYTMSVSKDHIEVYKQYMTDVAMLFGATDRNHISFEMEKVLDFGEKLEKVGEKNRWDFENETDVNYTAVLMESRFSIEEFQSNYDDIDWLEFINMIMYPMANISSDDYAIFPKPEFLDAFFSLIGRTPKKIQANFIIWRVIDQIMPFFPKKFKYLEGNYTCLTQQDSSTSKDRFDYCKRLLSGSILPESSNIIYARKYLPQEKREKVQELVDSIKEEFKTILMENSWMDDETKEKAVEKADGISAIIGAPGDYFSDEIFEKYGMINYTEGESFLSMILRRSKYENDMMFSAIQASANDSIDMFYDLTTKVNAMYSPTDNALMLPTAILQGVFYNPDRPMYLNYGAIGSIIGHELTHGFSKGSSKYDSSGKETGMWPDETVKAYDEVTQCMIKDAEDFDVEDTEQTINGTQTLEENIADFAGIKAAYAAYRTWVEENGEELPLPGVDYTPQQLFWISAISYECYKVTGDKLEKGLERDSHAHNAFRATAPMRNNEDFANDFSCPADSKMNPPEKCQVF